MYESFFSLATRPFQLTPDPDFLFLGQEHRKALIHLNYGVSENIGFILVTGEVGTGKTTLLKTIMRELRRDITVAHVNNTRVSTDQLFSMINDEFGIDTQGKQKSQMLRDLHDFIIHQYAQRKRTALIIDEAQNLSSSLLEEIRLLSNLETEKEKLLQIILIGQPELRMTLNRPEMRQLRQRISISCHINPLTRTETEAYIFHRLEQAGNRDAAEFESGVIDAVHSFARGIPRLINIACDFILLTAFTQSTRQITLELAREVLEDLDKNNAYWQDADNRPEAGPEISDNVRLILDRLSSLECAVHEKDLQNYVPTSMTIRNITSLPDPIVLPGTAQSETRDARLLEQARMEDELFRLRRRVDILETESRKSSVLPPQKPGEDASRMTDTFAPEQNNKAALFTMLKAIWAKATR